ncbi:MAG TPA: helix-turn-helix domain-containing protein [Pirellulaceae bacterium]|jgi:hypothetical protein
MNTQGNKSAAAVQSADAKNDPQGKLDFARSEQLAMLREAILEPVEIQEAQAPRRVMPKTMKTVLRTLDDHAGGRDKGCWASLDTIARETGLSRRQVVRVLAALESLSLICVETPSRRGVTGVTSTYTIVWNELNLLTKARTNQSAQGSRHSAQGSRHSAQGAPEAPKEAPQEVFGQRLDHKPRKVDCEAWERRTFEFLTDLKLAYSQESIDVRMVAQVAWLVEAGHEILPQVRDAIRGATMTEQPPTNRMRYFRGCLNDKLGGKERVTRLLRYVAPPRSKCQAVLPQRETLARDESGELANVE